MNIQPDHNQHRVLKVVLASPSDVLKERQEFYRVVDAVNTTLQHTESRIQLKALGWESAPPDAGSPQEVIDNQLHINECDIFIGIFWKRFGMPPGGKRPDGSRSYLSGTEKEIDDAFEARRSNKTGRPIIMLYRKTDPPPPNMSDDDYLQYAEVIKFFHECGPKGEHPALTYEFKDDEFGSCLEEHLLKNITKIKNNPFPSSSATTEPTGDPKDHWFARVRLTDNPFESWTAEQEYPKANDYYVAIGGHQPETVIREPASWVLFANPGCGKTALAQMLDTLCFPKKPTSQVLYLRFGKVELQNLLARQEPDAHEIDPTLFLRSLMASAVQTLNIQGRHPASGTRQIRSTNQLAGLLGSAGLRKALCIVDQVDELTAAEGDPVRIASLIKPILIPGFREPLQPELTFRYFLPASLESQLIQDSRQFRLDRCRVTHLTWEVSDLKRMLGERLSQYADPAGSYRNLGQLCDPTNGFAAAIDLEIAELAEGCPRAAIWLASRLIEIHCGHPEPQDQIQEISWLKAQQDWWRSGRNQILGATNLVDGFRMRGQDVYFGEHKVALTPVNTRLMQALIAAGDSGCSSAQLMEAHSPGNQGGVTSRAIQQALARLRQQLADGGFDANWVHTDHGRGYRLLNPQTTPRKVEDR